MESLYDSVLPMGPMSFFKSHWFFFFNFLVENGGKKQKMAKPIKGYLSSSNAYLLVYTASDFGLDSTPLTEDSLQEHLRTKLNEYNDSFDSVISQSREEKVCC